LDVKKHACWLVMEYCAARPLLAGGWSEQQLREVAQQLLETLHYLHQRAIAHRDIKLENILFDPAQRSLKLIDFGICRKHRRRGAKFPMLTITGTLFYRAPEMFTGGGYDQKVDIWALGVLLFKLVAGRTPFESEYHSQTISNILAAQVAFPPAFDAYSRQLAVLIGRIFSKTPKERPSAIECLRDGWFCDLTVPSPSRHKGSLDVFEDEEGLQSPVVDHHEEVNLYVRQINGAEFHCIDSDDESGQRPVLKRQHRSLLVELNSFTL
jgi:calcium-dependent protein kinase